jgi:hypothetical protein
LLVADLAVDVEHERAEQVSEAPHGGVRRDAGRVLVEDDRLRPRARERVDHAVGDLVERLLPRDALPAALATLARALQRMAQARGVVHHAGVADALLAAAGIEIRHFVVRRRILRDLFFPHDGAVFDEDVERAVALVPAVDQVRALRHAVPPQLLAVPLLRRPVRFRRHDGGRLGRHLVVDERLRGLVHAHPFARDGPSCRINAPTATANRHEAGVRARSGRSFRARRGIGCEYRTRTPLASSAVSMPSCRP